MTTGIRGRPVSSESDGVTLYCSGRVEITDISEGVTKLRINPLLTRNLQSRSLYGAVTIKEDELRRLMGDLQAPVSQHVLDAYLHALREKQTHIVTSKSQNFVTMSSSTLNECDQIAKCLKHDRSGVFVCKDCEHLVAVTLEAFRACLINSGPEHCRGWVLPWLDDSVSPAHWWIITMDWSQSNISQKYYIAVYDSNTWCRPWKKSYAINHIIDTFIQLLGIVMIPNVESQDWVFQYDTVSA